MNIITSTAKQQLNEVDVALVNTLQDIANKVELQPNFQMYHPEYKPFELPEDIVANLRKMPLEIQQRYNSLQLRGFLYGIYYNGHLKNTLSLKSDTKNFPTDLENSTFLGIDQDFLGELHIHNTGKGYYDSGWSVLKEKNESTLVVCKGDLKLIVARNGLQPNQAKVSDTVAILLPKNLIQKGFYLAVGNAGSYQDPQSTVRIYFNITPQGAIALMETLSQELNSNSIPFIFKVLYNPSDYKRYDAGVLYFDKLQYEAIKSAVKAAYTEHQTHFHSEVPLFTKKLMPGLGLAEQPTVQFSASESFGENRCQIVANGILEATQKGDTSPEGKMQAICQQFANAKVDLKFPYLNASSKDIYGNLI